MNITKSVMDKIKKNEVKMKPKAVFVVANILLGLGIALSILMSILSVNFIFRQLDQQPFIRLPGLGRTGFVQFFHDMPWLYITTTIIFLGLGLYLLTKTEAMYRKSLLSLGVVLLLLVIISGFIFNKTGLGRQLGKQSGMSKFLSTEETDIWIKATVVSINDTSVKVRINNNRTLTLKISQNTILPALSINEGDCVRASGTLDGTTLITKGIYACPERFPAKN